MRAFALHRGEKHGELTGRILCQDVPGVFRKGHVLREQDIPLLIEAAWSELHLLELGPDDVAQREAGQRLAQSLAAPGLRIAPSGHRHVVRAAHSGLLKIDTAALQRMNATPGIAVFTQKNDAVVSGGDIVAEAQITPLAIARNTLDAVARERGIVRLLPFHRRDAVVLIRDDRGLCTLTDKLRWFLCDVTEVLELPRDAASIRGRIEEQTATLIIISGSNALDPLDPVFDALAQMGATVQRVGMPVHPGTLLWIASWKDTAIIGLPTCGLGSQVTAFDLVLPKILAQGAITDADLAALGHGGILTASPFAPARAGEKVAEGRTRGPS